VNFGIYRPDATLVEPGGMLAGMAEAGYDGVDSGPIGYLRSDDLARAGLGLAGG
jgi:inosose dehydratase